ncbi:histidine phosphatase family protein [bacterium]|nr:histidine phosphatase family protein [bacterium]
MRHAKSSWSDGALADFDRPLNKRGVDSALKMGRLIADLALIPDVILSSSSRRTRETVELFVAECPFMGEIHFTRDLYHGGLEEILESVFAWGNEFSSIMVVGHNPGMEFALEEFTGRDERMVTAAIAQIEFEIDDWTKLDADVQGQLVNFWRPREVD